MGEVSAFDRKRLGVQPVYKNVEDVDLDVLECYTLVRLLPAAIECGSKVLGVVADDVLVDVIALLLGTDEDGDDLALGRSSTHWVSDCDSSSCDTQITYPYTGETGGTCDLSAMALLNLYGYGGEEIEGGKVGGRVGADYSRLGRILKVQVRL